MILIIAAVRYVQDPGVLDFIELVVCVFSFALKTGGDDLQTDLQKEWQTIWLKSLHLM